MTELIQAFCLGLLIAALVSIPAALISLVIELRAVRKVLQARWDYDRLGRWFEYAGGDGTTYRRFGSQLLEKPCKLPCMSATPHKQHLFSKEKCSQP